MTKASTFHQDASLDRFLRNFPQNIADSFTTEQLQAMQIALQATRWRQHPIDIRLTVPILWKKFYLVLVAGPERRSTHRRQIDRGRNPVWTLANVSFVTAFVSLGIALSVGLFQTKVLLLDFVYDSTLHPAAIPFKPDKKSCEESGREWHEGECIDYAHDPIF